MKKTFHLTVLSVANVLMNFSFQWYVIFQLGAGMETDALFAGMTIPQLISAVVSGTLMHVLVPILVSNNIKRQRFVSWSLITFIGSFFGTLSILLCVSAKWWIPLTVPGFDEQTTLLTIELARIQLISIVFSSIYVIQWAFYYANKRFIFIESVTFLSNVTALLLLIFALPQFGIISVAWIMTFKLFFQFLILFPGLGKPAWPNFKIPEINLGWRRGKHLLLGTTYYMSEPLVERVLLSNANSGSLSLFYLAQQIYGAISEVISKVIVNPLIPLLSELHELKDQEGFKRIYHEKLMYVVMLSLIGTVLFGIVGHFLLFIINEHIKITKYDLDLLFIIMLSMIGRFALGNIGMIMSSMILSVGDTKLHTQIGIISFTIGVTIKIIMFNYFGVIGLALGITLNYIAYLFMLASKIRYKYHI